MARWFRDPFGRLVKGRICLPITTVDIPELPTITSVNTHFKSGYPETRFLIPKDMLNKVFDSHIDELPLRTESHFKEFMADSKAFVKKHGTDYSFIEQINFLGEQDLIDLFLSTSNPDYLHVGPIGIEKYILDLVMVSICKYYGGNTDAPGKDSQQIIDLLHHSLFSMPRIRGYRVPKCGINAANLKGHERSALMQACATALIGLGLEVELRSVISYLRFAKAVVAQSFSVTSLKELNELRKDAQQTMHDAWFDDQKSNFKTMKFFSIGKFRDSIDNFGPVIGFSGAPFESKHTDFKKSKAHRNGRGEVNEQMQLLRHYRNRTILTNLASSSIHENEELDDDLSDSDSEPDLEMYDFRGESDGVFLPKGSSTYFVANTELEEPLRMFMETRNKELPTKVQHFVKFDFTTSEKVVKTARALPMYHGRPYFSDIQLKSGEFGRLKMIFTTSNREQFYKLALMRSFVYVPNLCPESGLVQLQFGLDVGSIDMVVELCDVYHLACIVSPSVHYDGSLVENFRVNPFVPL